MEIQNQENLTDWQKQQVIALWNEGYPRQLNYSCMAEFDTYLNALPDKKHYLLLANDSVIGWALTFIRDDERWFAIVLSAAIQGQGFGTALLTELKNREDSLRGWVIDHEEDVLANGMPYRSPMAFYKKHHFEVIEDCRIDTELKGVKIVWIKGR